jgi:hypothetical protein
MPCPLQSTVVSQPDCIRRELQDMKFLIFWPSLLLILSLCPNIRLSNLFANNLSLRFSPNVLVVATGVEMVMIAVINTLKAIF